MPWGLEEEEVSMWFSASPILFSQLLAAVSSSVTVSVSISSMESLETGAGVCGCELACEDKEEG